MLHGLLNLPIWGDILATLILTQITIASVTIYLHRCQAHRGLDLHPIISHFFRFWLWLTTGQVTKQWVAVHRKHHALVDNEGDPHSPVIFGIRKVLLEGAELYQEEIQNQETLDRYGKGTPDDWLERHVYQYNSMGLVLMFILDIMLFGVLGITIWAVQMMWIPIFAAGVINGVGHFWGYRNFESQDASRNIMPWAFFIGGEELHNNHHTYPSSAKLSVKWWEFDIGWLYIKTLRLFHLAKIHKVPPRLTRDPKKSYIDKDTLYAVFMNRFQIMATYSQEVLIPVMREERNKAGEASRALFKKAKSLLTREASLVDDQHKKRLSVLLEKYQSLDLAYKYRERLQAIWQRTSDSQKELIEALQEWCRQAEATGLESLKRFADLLKSYTIQPA